MEKLIYIVDDEENIRLLMQTFLESEGYETRLFSDGTGVLKAFEEREPDLVILDVMMPGEDGFTVCTRIRERSMVPVIIVSAKGTPMDRIAGIMLGSDDYVTKPFLPLELVTRVKALLRRVDSLSAAAEKKRGEILECGNLRLNRESRKITVGGENLSVTPTEFDFLNYLIEKKETAVSRKELLEKIWGYQGMFDDARVSDDLVKRLRKKMREKGAAAWIKTVRGYGYYLTEEEEEP